MVLWSDEKERVVGREVVAEDDEDGGGWVGRLDKNSPLLVN